MLAIDEAISDERPFAEVLRDWMARHGLTAYAASHQHGGPIEATEAAIGQWLSGKSTPRQPRAYLALMILHDEGRLPA